MSDTDSHCDSNMEKRGPQHQRLPTLSPGIHQPYQVIRSLPLGEFNNLAGSLGFEPRWCCRGSRIAWRSHPSYNNCPHFCTITTTTALNIRSSSHIGVRPSASFSVGYKELSSLQDNMDTQTPIVLKYLISSDQKHILVIFKAKDALKNIGVIFDVANNIIGYYMVTDNAQFQVKFVRQFMLGASEDILVLVVERQSCDRTSFTRQTFELWSFQRNTQHNTKFDMLHVHNSIESAMRIHGPLFTSVPGHGGNMYCVAFFKDSYRLKNLYGTYFIALIYMAKNRYWRVVGPDGAGLRQIDKLLHEVHFHHIEASPCGTYLGVSMERMPGFQMQVLLLDMATLRLVHTVYIPLFLGSSEGFLNAACCSNARVIFSKCSTRMSIFYLPAQPQQPINGITVGSPVVRIYQLPVVLSLTAFSKFQLLRSMSKVTIARLPLPDVLKRFILGTSLPPTEEEYID